MPETSFNNYEPLDNHKKQPPPPEEHLPPSQGDATEDTTAKEEPVMEEEEENGQWYSLYLTSGCGDILIQSLYHYEYNFNFDRWEVSIFLNKHSICSERMGHSLL